MAGDIGETEAHLSYALAILTQRFARIVWVPGNHDLWTVTNDSHALRGVAKYQRLVAICRDYGVLTPEDPFVRWPGEGQPCLLAPLFVLYDYTFRPDSVPAEQALAWAEATGVVCSDEVLLHAEPYPSRIAWCAARCLYSEARLEAIGSEPLVLINHFPPRNDLVRLPRIPRFSLWCGTRRTEDWHVRFAVEAVVYGHLHRRATDYRNAVRFEEVSLGYPRDWQHDRGLQGYLREILPGPPMVEQANAGPFWHA